MNINYNSVRPICGASDQIVVYGYSSCGYLAVKRQLSKSNIFKNVFGFEINDDRFGENILECIPNNKRTSPYRTPGKYAELTRECKAGLVAVVLENYKRIKQGQKKPLNLLKLI
jgi:hypothetical protein